MNHRPLQSQQNQSADPPSLLETNQIDRYQSDHDTRNSILVYFASACTRT